MFAFYFAHYKEKKRTNERMHERKKKKQYETNKRTLNQRIAKCVLISLVHSPRLVWHCKHNDNSNNKKKDFFSVHHTFKS